MSRQIMTPERIAEFRDAIANHPHFGIGGDALSKILDALDAAQQEIAARDAEIAKMQEQFREFAERSESDATELRKEIADLKRGGVVVPEMPAETALALIAIDWPNRTIDVLATAGNIREWLRKNARTIPADRVLGEGCVSVDREELCLLRQLESGWREPYDLSAGERARIITRLDVLRAQPTQEAAK